MGHARNPKYLQTNRNACQFYLLISLRRFRRYFAISYLPSFGNEVSFVLDEGRLSHGLHCNSPCVLHLCQVFPCQNLPWRFALSLSSCSALCGTFTVISYIWWRYQEPYRFPYQRCLNINPQLFLFLMPDHCPRETYWKMLQTLSYMINLYGFKAHELNLGEQLNRLRDCSLGLSRWKWWRLMKCHALPPSQACCYARSPSLRPLHPLRYRCWASY